jgi:Ca-activated chloride channel family protein
VKCSLGALIFGLFLTTNVSAMELEAVDLNNEGVAAFIKEEPYTAYTKLLEALKLDPFNAIVRLNLGLSFQANEEPAKAFKEYMTASRYAIDDEQRFYALFNAGNAASADGKIPKALEAYQLALGIKPGDKEVKTNIELLWKGGGGQGQGENKDKNDQQGKGEGEQNDQNQTGPIQKPKPQPKKFDSQKLTKKDVRKILEELKNQEQKIRAKEYEKGQKEQPKTKDW